MIEKITTPDFEQRKHFEQIREEAIKVLGTFESPEHFIDEGGAGKVYSLPGGNCMKILIERHNLPDSEKYNLGNTVEVETLLQEQMARTNYDGKARVPKTIAYLSGTFPIERSAILMEKLNATNLKHIINGQAELPKNFDLNSFFGELERFIQHMHDVEKIAHLDLYARNVMVDNDTGYPYIIDFGRSEKLTGNEEENTRKKEHDWDHCDEIFRALEALQNI